MLDIFKTRLTQGYQTKKYPKEAPVMPERFQGLPEINDSNCGTCTICIDACPANALKIENSKIVLDMNKCIFCGKCENLCPQKTISFTRDHSLAARSKKDLLLNAQNEFLKAKELEAERLGLFKKSFNLRQVSAGGCGACEADINVLTTLSFDLSRFGINLVASPRHADGMIITGPVSKNMEYAVKNVYDAISAPKVVIAVGTCAISGGLYENSEETLTGVADVLPVDLFIPGCPPHPYTILDGLLRLIGRI
jgi:Ni,Fe-hydrogenase III small subunit/ferredoxin